MDTLSSSVSTFNVIPSLYPKSHGFHHHFKLAHLIPASTSTTKRRNPKLPKKASTFTAPRNNSINININPTFVNPSQSLSSDLPQLKHHSNPSEAILLFHHKASTGYAVALLDLARCNVDLLQEISRDVKRLSRWLSNEQVRGIIGSPCVEKGEIVREILSKGHFHKQLVKLVKLLVEKNKVEMVNDVLMEFTRVCDEFIGSSNNTQVVFVSSEVKMEENQVLRIAKRVQKISGADKVKVRQLVEA